MSQFLFEVSSGFFVSIKFEVFKFPEVVPRYSALELIYLSYMGQITLEEIQVKVE